MRYSMLAVLLSLVSLAGIASEPRDDIDASAVAHAPVPLPACSSVVAATLQPQSGTANATGDTQADACSLAQARARSAAQQSCDGPFSVDDCRCIQNPGAPVSYSCSARWRCQ